MGDSTCLMQPFCYASGISNDANQSNPIHALGQSVSFGRFMSESLSWEKWSSFSHNRYVEEAERFSRPGSVAQKKAFFEAHYKKLAAQKAAALLEQQANNAASNNVTEQQQEEHEEEAPHDNDNDNTHDSQATTPTTKLVCNEEQQDVKVVNCSTTMKEPEEETETQAFAGSSMNVELQKNQLEDVDEAHKDLSEKSCGTPLLGTSVLEQRSNCDQDTLASKSKKKPPVSSLKVLKANNGVTKLNSTPAKPSAPISYHNKDNIMSTPMSNKPGLNSVDKKKSTPKSLHMPVNFTPIRELNRLTASVMRKFENARVGAASSSKASRDTSSTTPLRTPTMVSKIELQKHPSMTPLTEKKRSKTPMAMGSSASGSHTAGSKWRLLSTENNQMRSPVIFSPFSLRTEERAARRKKKLEEKFNANEAQKVQLHTKLKAKAETEIRKLRQSFCFKARPLPEFYKERKVPKIETDTYQLTHPESPKLGRKCSSKSSVTPQRSSVKNNGVKNLSGKNGPSSTYQPLTLNSRIIAHENRSPNIQHGNQNDSFYKTFTQRLEQSIARRRQNAWQKNLDN